MLTVRCVISYSALQTLRVCCVVPNSALQTLRECCVVSNSALQTLRVLYRLIQHTADVDCVLSSFYSALQTLTVLSSFTVHCRC